MDVSISGVVLGCFLLKKSDRFPGDTVIYCFKNRVVCKITLITSALEYIRSLLYDNSISINLGKILHKVDNANDILKSLLRSM